MKQGPMDNQSRIHLARQALDQELWREALKLLKKFEKRKGVSTDVLKLIGAAYFGLENFKLAGRYFGKAAEVKGGDSSALHFYAKSLIAQGELLAAESALEKALTLDPTNVGITFEQGLLLMRFGKQKEAEACMDACLAAGLKTGQFYVAYAENKRVLKKFGQSLASLRAALDLDETNQYAKAGLCLTLAEIGQFESAAEVANSIIASGVSDHVVIGEVADGLEKSGLELQAVKLIEVGVPNYELNPQLLKRLLKYLLSLGQATRAQELIKRWLVREPASLEANMIFAEVSISIGEVEPAKEVLNKLWRTDSTGYAQSMLSGIASKEDAPILLNEFRTYSPLTPQVIDEAVAVKQFSEATLLEKSHEYRAAFEGYCAANASKRELIHYDIELVRQSFESDRRIWDQVHKCEFGEQAVSGVQPIFVLGMPRSGTTMIEQLLGQQEKVAPLGELKLWGQLVSRVKKSDPKDQRESLIRAGQFYLNSVSHIAPGATFIVDKMPSNFRWVGYLLEAMPSAKIIHMTRSPQAVLWSNFKTNFAELDYSYSFHELAAYFQLYREMMSFWASRYGARIYDLDYELFTESPAEEQLKLFSFLGFKEPLGAQEVSLPTSGALIRTASQSQSRGVIYKGSSENWRNYDRFLPDSILKQKKLKLSELPPLSKV